VWDPHTGAVAPAEQATAAIEHGQAVTRVRLKLGAARSVFLVSAVGK